MNTPTHDNLYLPGLTADGQPRFLCALPGYWTQQLSDQHRGGKGDFYLDEALTHMDDVRTDRMPVSSVIMLDQIDAATGRILQRTVTHNVVTDNGAQSLLKLFTNAAGSLAQFLWLDNTGVASQLSGAVGSAVDLTTFGTSSIGVSIVSTGTSSPGNAATLAGNKAASYISNTTNTPCTSGAAGSTDTVLGSGIALSYGTVNQEYCSGHATQSNAGNIKIAAGVTHFTHAINDWCVAYPATSDGLSLSARTVTPIVYNSTASSNTASGTAAGATVSGTGIGSRQVQFIDTFLAGSTPGSYTELWVATAQTIAALNAATTQYAHVSFQPQAISSTVGIQVTYTIKI